MAEAKTNVTNKKEEMVTIKLKKKKDEDAQFVGVNFKTFRIQRGVAVQVPLYVKTVLDNSDLAEEMAEAFVEERKTALEEKAKNTFVD